jgi:hypothetical protein
MDYIGYPVVSLSLKPSSQTKFIRVAFESHGTPLDLIFGLCSHVHCLTIENPAMGFSFVMWFCLQTQSIC